MTHAHDRHAALLVADVQNDFCTGGALAVQGSERVVASLNRYIEAAVKDGLTVYACRDWHPPATSHFAAYGGKWPVHCVQGTFGAQFHPALHLPSTAVVISKGEDPGADGYSAFEARTADGSSLRDLLERARVTHVYIGGIATDYCIRASALDALSAGLTVTVLLDAVAGVNQKPGDSAQAIEEMRKRGARVVERVDTLVD